MVEFDRFQYSEKIKFLAKEFQRTAKKDENWLSNIGNMYASKVYKESVLDDLEFVYTYCSSSSRTNINEIIDFGCGSGITTGILADLGLGVTGLEYTGNWVDGPLDSDLLTKQVNQYKKCHDIILKNFDLKNLKFDYYKDKEDLLQLEPRYVTMFAVWEHLEKSNRDDLIDFLNSRINLEKIFITKLPRKYSWQENVARLMRVESHSKIYTLKMFKKEISKLHYSISRFEVNELFLNHPNYLANFLFPLTKTIQRFKVDRIFKFFMHDFRILLTRS
jgi:SAM-dependent methyltransferase